MKSRLRKAGLLTACGMLAVTIIGNHEGLRTRAYKDVVGVPTICFGETRNVRMGDVKSVAECQYMLGSRLEEFEKETLQNPRCVTNPDAIPDKSYVVFLSLAYNIGSNAFCKSTAVRYINSGDISNACYAIERFNRAGGVVWKGLVRRRAEERELCLQGLREGMREGVRGR